jgi:hypothetical protein
MGIQLEYLSGKNWKLVRQFSHTGSKGTKFVIPEGFETDLASVPKLLWWLIPPFDDRFLIAALVHDFLYRVEVPAGKISRSDADGVFRRLMRLHGVPRLQRSLMWAAVRLSRLSGLRSKSHPYEVFHALGIGVPFLLVLIPVLIPVVLFSLLFMVLNFVFGV